MKKMILLLFCISFCTVKAQEPSRPQQPMLKVFLDCESCDINYLSQNLNYVSFLRDQKNADVHILVRLQLTGSDGYEYELEFFGQNDYSNLFNRITFLSATTNTPVEIRDQMLANLSTGLLFFSLQRNKNFDKNFDQNLDRKSKDSAVVASKPKETKDPWNKWVFNIGANGNLSGEETSEFTNYSFDFSAKQVTEMNKFYIRWSYTNAKSKFTFGETTINSINRLSSLNIGNTFSIAKHWSIGGFLQVGSSDYANLSLYTSFKPAIEYSIFPYEEASKKQITVSYLIGGINNVYN